MSRPYGFFDHTADLGLRARGRTLEELFRHAAEGLMAAICDRRTIRRAVARSITAVAPTEDDDPALLLVSFLSEMLFLAEVECFLARDVRVTFPDPRTVRAVAVGEPLSTHRIKREIKAVTYHQVSVSRRGPHYRARVVVDI